MRTGIIGGGLCGLTAAIRLAQRGVKVDVFEAAPSAGGRTRSFFDSRTGQWVDNGPHLLSGAYQQTIQLLNEAGASEHIHWQDSLSLPLWDAGRGHFQLHPNPALPLALSLPWACARLPGHGWNDIPALLRLAGLLKRPVDDAAGVEDWMGAARIPQALLRDLLEPMCLGAMNESWQQANAASFQRVLRDAFTSHANARLGWFNKPLSEALIAPLTSMAEKLGVRLHTATRIQHIRKQGKDFELRPAHHPAILVEQCILALPLRSAQQLLGTPASAITRRISNIHLWFADMPPLPHPFIGGIGTTGQWFFDVSSQMPEAQAAKETGLRHICAVISADDAALHGDALLRTICNELAGLTGRQHHLTPGHVRMVSEQHATTNVLAGGSALIIPAGMIDACEAPHPGELPATIEYAVRRGNQAAEQCYFL